MQPVSVYMWLLSTNFWAARWLSAVTPRDPSCVELTQSDSSGRWRLQSCVVYSVSLLVWAARWLFILYFHLNLLQPYWISVPTTTSDCPVTQRWCRLGLMLWRRTVLDWARSDSSVGPRCSEQHTPDNTRITRSNMLLSSRLFTGYTQKPGAEARTVSREGGLHPLR